MLKVSGDKRSKNVNIVEVNMTVVNVLLSNPNVINVESKIVLIYCSVQIESSLKGELFYQCQEVKLSCSDDSEPEVNLF